MAERVEVLFLFLQKTTFVNKSCFLTSYTYRFSGNAVYPIDNISNVIIIYTIQNLMSWQQHDKLNTVG